jgi:hypothetical protein
MLTMDDGIVHNWFTAYVSGREALMESGFEPYGDEHPQVGMEGGSVDVSELPEHLRTHYRDWESRGYGIPVEEKVLGIFPTPEVLSAPVPVEVSRNNLEGGGEGRRVRFSARDLCRRPMRFGVRDFSHNGYRF